MNTHVEKKIVIFLNKLHWVPLDFASKIISNIAFLSVLWFAVIIFAMSIDFSFGLDIFVKLIMVFILHYIISEGIIKHGAKKLSLQRIRPYVAFPKEIRGIGRNFSDSSFPSDATYFFWKSNIGPDSLAFAVLLAFSRLHNGMHYPSDILAGIFLGLMYGNIVLALF